MVMRYRGNIKYMYLSFLITNFLIKMPILIILITMTIQFAASINLDYVTIMMIIVMKMIVQIVMVRVMVREDVVAMKTRSIVSSAHVLKVTFK